MRSKSLGFAIAALGVLLSCATARCDVILVDNGKPNCTIIIPDKATDNEKLAAKELQTYLKKMSGAELPIATDKQASQGNRILLGNALPDSGATAVRQRNLKFLCLIFRNLQILG